MSRCRGAFACASVITIAAALTAAQDERPAETQGATAQNNALVDEITPELNDAVTRGLAALAATQNDDERSDGTTDTQETLGSSGNLGLACALATFDYGADGR